jgi:hypothetical protein
MYPVSYDVAMGQCQRKLTKVEHDIMEGAIPAALLEFRDKKADKITKAKQTLGIAL